MLNQRFNSYASDFVSVGRRHIMQKAIPALSFAIMLFFLIQTAPAGEIAITITDDVGVYARGQNLSGTISIAYSRYIPRDSNLTAYINNIPASRVSLYDKLYDLDYYVFEKQYFGYNMTARGTNTWTEYPEQYFDYTVTANGTCGGDYCDPVPGCSCPADCIPPGSYPCNWSVSWSSDIPALVNGGEGLKQIKDMSFLGLPLHQNNNTLWSVTDTNITVETTMREACGGQGYAGYPVSHDGWVRTQINPQQIIGGGTRYWAQMPPFDHNSLDLYRDLYIANESVGLGGIYGVLGGQREYMGYVPECPVQTNNTQVFWNGTTGYIEICKFNPVTTYIINFLPPNGPILCAYTQVSIPGSEIWSRIATVEDGTTYCNYTTPYTENHTENDLTGYFGLFPERYWPSCPPDCNRVINSYEVTESSDPEDSVSITYNADAKTVNVTATTASTDITRSYTAEEYLSSFSNLKAPSTGNYTLTIKLVHDTSVLANGSMDFVTCRDNDNDGFCSSGEGGNDCDDNDRDVHPDANETCNGEDDDCDGICWEGDRHSLVCMTDNDCPEGKCRRIDEDFYGTGMLGEPCGVGSCTDGYYICTGNGTGVECSKKPVREMCENGEDDDCDRYTDELYEYVSNGQILAVEFANDSLVILQSDWRSGDKEDACMWCLENDIRDCGSNEGRCRAGYRVCHDGMWGDCINEIPPIDETCNRIDDDCDGITDNVGRGASIEATQCGCFGGATPSPEACNDIDDNCNGETDEGLVCCTPGDTRSCAEAGSRGECALGIQTCTAEGGWGICSIQPVSEICYNNLDDNCNGEADEICSPEITCYNMVQDTNEEGIDCGGPCPEKCETFFIWMIIAGALILCILAVWVLALKKKI